MFYIFYLLINFKLFKILNLVIIKCGAYFTIHLAAWKGLS